MDLPLGGGMEKNRPVYVISVAAELVEMHPQTLRLYLAGVEEIMRLREELEALQNRFEQEVERLKAELGERLRALETPPALPAPASAPKRPENPKDRPVYVISVAAELVEMHPQTLRLYERKGLIKPRRSAGKTRLYSERDIERLREIRRLTQELGVNLAGVEEIMRLREELEALQNRFESEIARLKLQLLQTFESKEDAKASQKEMG